jgi:hypothetical protein
VWRVSLLWHGTLLDTVTVRRRARVALRTGEQWRIDVDGDALVLQGPDAGDDARLRLSAGQVAGLPAGHAVLVERDLPVPRVAADLVVDSTFLHAAMVGIAATVCMFSALWFAPLERAGDAGAGLPSDARRWLTLPGGSARFVGRPTFSPRGRQAQLAEKLRLERPRGTPSPARGPGPAPSLERTLEAMKAALRGADGTGTRDAIGELTRAIAAAPVLGAGVGGLAPRDPADAGPGSGLIAAGDTARLRRELRAQRLRAEEKQDRSPPPPRPLYTATLLEPDSAAVVGEQIDARPDLDPVVREHLLRAVRLRHNVLRGCYESWGYGADRHAAGRVVVELTLRPDGHVADVVTESSEGLGAVGECVRRAAVDWYLGDGLVDEPVRLSFPFLLKPRGLDVP